MVWILLCLAVIAAMYYVSDFMFVSVRVYDVKKTEDPSEYFCKFFWRGREREGYFFWDEGSVPKDDFFNVIGVDCYEGLWCLEHCSDNQKEMKDGEDC